LTILSELMKDGATIRAYDPASMEESTKLLPGMVPCQDAYDVAEGADALIIMTEWNQFRNLDFERLKKCMRLPLLLDLRNTYDTDRVVGFGFRHVSVGRPTKDPLA
jgi:UDPglucose 6-dehydrogenase